ncbi:hypothetical protein HDV63DRAFT_387777, partial [Trichoderma sp. SZMC 28014]
MLFSTLLLYLAKNTRSRVILISKAAPDIALQEMGSFVRSKMATIVMNEAFHHVSPHSANIPRNGVLSYCSCSAVIFVEGLFGY